MPDKTGRGQALRSKCHCGAHVTLCWQWAGDKVRVWHAPLQGAEASCSAHARSSRLRIALQEPVAQRMGHTPLQVGAGKSAATKVVYASMACRARVAPQELVYWPSCTAPACKQPCLRACTGFGEASAVCGRDDKAAFTPDQPACGQPTSVHMTSPRQCSRTGMGPMEEARALLCLGCPHGMHGRLPRLPSCMGLFEITQRPPRAHCCQAGSWESCPTENSQD